MAIYSVADLSTPPGLDPIDESSGEPVDKYRQVVEAKRLELLVRAIREYLRPKLLLGLDEVRELPGGTLVVTATAEQHEWIRRFLELQRRSEAPRLMFNTKQLRATKSELEALGLDGPTQMLPDEQHADQFIAKIESAGIETLASPRFLIGAGTPAYMDLFNEVAYVKRYDVVYVHPGPEAIVDPVIDVIKEGTHCELAGIEIEPGLYALEIEFERTEIERPIPTKEVRVTINATPVTISQPVVLTSQLSSTVLLRDGAGVWFRIPDGEQELLVIVKLDLVDSPPESRGPRDMDAECPVEDAERSSDEIVDEELPPGEQRAREVPR
jgi:hypothetical protein